LNRQGPNKIPYVDYTWNPVTGCYHGCSYCFARPIAKRFTAKDNNFAYGTILYDEKLGVNIYEQDCTAKPQWWIEGHKIPFPVGFEPTFYHERLDEPKGVKKPSKIFVSDMGDLFGDWVPDYWIGNILEVIHECPQHTFLLLTKNPKRYLEFNFPDNAWPGTSIEDQPTADLRLPYLVKARAKVRFVSYEPALGPVDLEQPVPGSKPVNGVYPPWMIQQLDLVICGGASGPKAAPLHPDWVRSVRDQCQTAGVPFLFKSWGEWVPMGSNFGQPDSWQGRGAAPKSWRPPAELNWRPGWDGKPTVGMDGYGTMVRVGKKVAGRLLDGQEWSQWPEVQA
jgi:protein gp37